MAGAGLAHGGFYSYFRSKSDLYSEVLGCFFTDPEWKSCWEGVHVNLSSTNVGRAKRAFEKVFKAMVSVLERSLGDKQRPSRIRARATAALCVGGMVVARSMLGRGLADQLRSSGMGMATEIGGWRVAGKARLAGRSRPPHTKPA